MVCRYACHLAGFLVIRKLVLSAAACSLCAGASAADSSSQTLSHKQLIRQVVGNTIHFQGPDFDVYEYLGPEGEILGFSTKTGAFHGRWRIIRGNLLCLEHDDPMQSGCAAVALKPGQVEFHRLDGVVEGPFDFQSGNPRNLTAAS